MENRFLFTSERLGFRNWNDHDLTPMAAINSNPEVMAFFPDVKSEEETYSFINRMQKQYTEYGYCYFAVETIRDHIFIGFIGIAKQTYEADYTPCIDIGWRLGKEFWGNGYATEGAKRCLEFGFDIPEIPKIVSIAPEINHASIQVMKKIGMAYIRSFEHPLLMGDIRLKKCVLYESVKAK